MSETQGITVQEFNIFTLGGEAVSYHLKDIHTIALQVTPGNIGILSLEFEVELNYSSEGDPYIDVWVARGSAKNPEGDRGLTFRPDDWIVILWDEIHKFRDPEFKATFSFDGLSTAGEAEMVKYAEADVKLSERLLKSAIIENPYNVQGNPVGGPGIETVVVDTEKTQITSAVGDLYPEGEGPMVKTAGKEPWTDGRVEGDESQKPI